MLNQNLPISIILYSSTEQIREYFMKTVKKQILNTIYIMHENVIIKFKSQHTTTPHAYLMDVYLVIYVGESRSFLSVPLAHYNVCVRVFNKLFFCAVV